MIHRPHPQLRVVKGRAALSHRFLAFVGAAALGVFSAILLWPQPEAQASKQPDITAKFGICGEGPRSTCIVDGDTIWLYGDKIRIADINTPEVTDPGCRAEAMLADTATRRLQQLLNEAPFHLAKAGRDEDRYGRKLRVILRGGHSLGGQLSKKVWPSVGTANGAIGANHYRLLLSAGLRPPAQAGRDSG